MPSRIANKQGKPIHGTLGFVGALLKIIRRTEPSHIAVLFDSDFFQLITDNVSVLRYRRGSLPFALNDLVYHFTEITTSDVLKGIGL